jgi:hypothetical protein
VKGYIFPVTHETFVMKAPLRTISAGPLSI